MARALTGRQLLLVEPSEACTDPGATASASFPAPLLPGPLRPLQR